MPCFEPARTRRSTSWPIEEPVVPLTPRELQILRLVARGFKNGEIAKQLGTRVGTVRNQISQILQKLGVENRVQAILKAASLGLV